MESPISLNPEILSGAPAFRGTRVFVQTLFDYVASGDTLESFLLDFPGVSREQALAVLTLAGEALFATLPTPEQVRLSNWILNDALTLYCISETGTDLRNLLAKMDAIDHSIASIHRLNETLRKLRGTGLIEIDGDHWRRSAGTLDRINQFVKRPKRAIIAQIEQWLSFLATLAPTADEGPDIDQATYDSALKAYQRMMTGITADPASSKRLKTAKK